MDKLVIKIESFIRSVIGLDDPKATLLEAFLPQLIATAILILIIKRYVWGSINGILQTRKQHVESQVSDVEDLKKNATIYEVECKSLLEASKKEALNIVDQAKKRAVTEGDLIIEKAKEDAKLKVERAKNEIDSEISKVRDDLKNEFADVAILAASKIIEKELSKDDHKSIIDETMKSLGN